MTILFFDEVNTNENVSGLLKEIIIDRHFRGRPIPENIRLVAACNPYKLKPESSQDNSSAGIKHEFAKSTMSRLVYSVNPLPDSMLYFIWDYGSLSSEEEAIYIRKQIEKLN